MTNVVSEFCRCIRAGEYPNASLDLGLRVVQVLGTCQAQLETASARPAA